MPELKREDSANSVDLDTLINDESPHQDLHLCLQSGASFTKKDRTISLKMSVRSFLRSAYVGFTKTS